MVKTMARARNIKPAIFKNELLGVADPLITLLFESLWCLADREGRLEDRPLRIKAETFPYRENLNINGYLTELSRMGFIVRYVIDGLPLIQIVNFKKHQTPHKTEKDSVLPAYNGESVDSCGFADTTVKYTLKNERKTEQLPPDLLIPDSFNLNPEESPQTPSGHIAQQKRGAISLKTFVDECKEKNERPLRDYKPLWDYTEKVGLSEDYVALAWAEFLRRFMPGGSQQEKRQKDWRCTFKKYIENNYFKLWAIDQSGTYFLTTMGKQAEKYQGES